MADLYTILAGIEPDQQDIIEAELQARQIISAKYPDMDLREGTAVRDLVLRPSAFLLALCKKGFDYYFAQNTLATVDDTTPTELVDDILSNLFLTRNTGTYAVISARLYFARQKSVSLSTGTSFSTDGQLLFYPATPINLPALGLTFDSFQNEWYVDVLLVAADKGTEYNLSSGSLLYFSNFDPFFLHAEINYLAQTSTGSETNTEFKARAATAISTRNLINQPSILHNLQANFNYLDKILIQGYSDELMYRDQIYNSLISTSVRLSDAGILQGDFIHVRVPLAAHGFVAGQLIDIQEFGGGVYYNHIPVTSVIDANNFLFSLYYTADPGRTFNQFYVSPATEKVWIHQGGCVDAYVGDTVASEVRLLYLDANGTAKITGPVYAINQVLGEVPGGYTEVPLSTPYTTHYDSLVVVPNPTFTQELVTSVTGNFYTVKCTLPNHGFVVGRAVQVNDWPTSGAYQTWQVSAVIDGSTFRLGQRHPLYTVTAGTPPTIECITPGADTGYTMDQKFTVDFGITYANYVVSFECKYIDKVESVQQYLDLTTNRVVCGDYKARGFNIYEVNLALTAYGASDTTTVGNLSALTEEYFAAIAPGQPLVFSDLLAKLGQSGLNYLKTPVSSTYTLYNKDLLPIINVTETDRIIPTSPDAIFVLGTLTLDIVEAIPAP